jgi:hypothetical protein
MKGNFKIQVLILIFGIIISSCDNNDKIPEPEQELDLRNIRAEFILIKSSAYDATRINFDFRMYFPKQDFTKFINDLQHYEKCEHVEDTLTISFDQKIYEGCKYQYLVSVTRTIYDSTVNEQYISLEHVIPEFPDSLYQINWPEDIGNFELVE